MRPDEIKSIEEIKGTPGFRVIEHYLNKKILELDSVSDIDLKSETRAGVQAIAKNKAVKVLKEFANELTFSPVQREMNRTFE